MSYYKLMRTNKSGLAVRFAGRGSRRPWVGMLAVASAAVAQSPYPVIPPFGNASGLGYDGLPPITAPSVADFDENTGSKKDLGALYDVALTRDLPYVPAINRPHKNYNLKFGDTTLQFTSAVAMVYSDNALQSGAGFNSDDFTVTPSLGIEMDARLTDNNSIRINVGVGYRYSMNYSQLNSLYIAPRSTIDYRIRIGDVLITLYDQLSTSADTYQRVDLRNRGTAAGVDFSRISNQSGISTAYSLARETSIIAGYSFGLDRGLNDAYSYYNSNSHNFNAALYQRLNTKLTVGLAASYNINEFLEARSSLSNSTGWSAGPLVSYHPTDWINFSASVRYQSISYEKIGGISAASNPGSATFDVSAQQRLTRYLSHQLSAGRSFNNSLSSAQMESLSATYGMTWLVNRKVSLSGSIAWQDFKQSANSLTQIFPTRESAVAALTGQARPDGSLLTALEAGQLYDFYSFQSSGDNLGLTLSTGYQITQKLNASLAYSHIIRTTDVRFGAQNNSVPGFTANTVSLGLNYRF